MQEVAADVRLKTLDGTWETVGTGRRAGISAESLRLTANEWGPDIASFTLKRDPGSIWPDLLAFTPVEISIGGQLVWDGFINQTPMTDNDGGSINVQAKGWQYHLDDDSTEKFWIHSKLTDWKDVRSFPSANINYFRAGQTASSGDGAITVGWPDNSYMQQNCFAGVVLDLGEYNTAAAISLTWTLPLGTARIGTTATRSTLKIVARTSDSIGDIQSGTDAFTPASIGAINTVYTTGGTWTTPKRYVMVGMLYQGGVGTADAEYIAKITNISIASKSSYYSSTTKQMIGVKPSDVVTDVLSMAPLLDQSKTGIQASSYTLPHIAAIGDAKTAREYMTLSNSYDDNSIKVVPGRQLLYNAKTEEPSTVIGEWPGSKFSDASSNSADEIYNRVVVEGTGADDQPLKVSRNASANAVNKIDWTSYLVNPTFEAASPAISTNWTTTNSSTIQRLSSTPIAGSYSANWGSITTEDAKVTGAIFASCPSFIAGKTYTLTVDFAWQSSTQLLIVPAIQFGDLSSANFSSTPFTADFSGNVSLYTAKISWTPTATVTAANVSLRFSADTLGTWFSDVGGTLKFDNITLSYAATTLIDRRGFIRTKRLQVTAPITSTTAGIIGDAFLATHSTTPLKGDVEIAYGGAREYTDGNTVHPAQLLLRTGELLHLSHRVDPDTGANGRDGRIASVSYDHSQQVASVSIDSQRSRFESLLERLSVITGNRLQK